MLVLIWRYFSESCIEEGKAGSRPNPARQDLQTQAAAAENPQPQVSAQNNIVSGLGNFFGGVANFFAVETPGAGGENAAVVPQVEEQTESYLPSLNFKRKLEGKSVLLTGATGAVGSAVAKKLLKCGLRKLVLMVRDREDLDPKIKEDLQRGQPGM